MPPLPISLGALFDRFLSPLQRSTEPRLQSLLWDYTADVPSPALHVAIRALSDTTAAARYDLFDTWRWLTLEGELYAVSDLAVMLTTNGVLLLVTTDVKNA